MTNETNKYIPTTTVVQADDNGDIDLPAWVRPGEYEYQKDDAGRIRLIPTGVYAIAYDILDGMMVDPMLKEDAVAEIARTGGYLVKLVDGEWVQQ